MRFSLVALILLATTAMATTAYQYHTDVNPYSCPVSVTGAITGCSSSANFDYGTKCTSRAVFTADYSAGDTVFVHAYFYPTEMQAENATYAVGILGDDFVFPYLSDADYHPDNTDVYASGSFHANGRAQVANKTGLSGTISSGGWEDLQLELLKDVNSGDSYHICIDGQPRTIAGSTYLPKYQMPFQSTSGMYWAENIYTGLFSTVTGTIPLAASFYTEAPYWDPLYDFQFTTTSEGWDSASPAPKWLADHGGSYWVPEATGGTRNGNSPNMTITGNDYIVLKVDYSLNLDKLPGGGYAYLYAYDGSTLVELNATYLGSGTAFSAASSLNGFTSDAFWYYGENTSQSVYYLVNATGHNTVRIRATTHYASLWIQALTVYGTGGSVPDTYTVNSYSIYDTGGDSTWFMASIESSKLGGPATSGVVGTCAVYGGDGTTYPATDMYYDSGDQKWKSTAYKNWSPRSAYRYTCTINGVTYYKETSAPSSFTMLSGSYVPAVPNTVYGNWSDANSDLVTDSTAYSITSFLGGGANTWTYSSSTGLWSTTFTSAGPGTITATVATTHFGFASNSTTITLTPSGAVNGTLISKCTGLEIEGGRATATVGALAYSSVTNSAGYYILAVPTTAQPSIGLSATGYDTQYASITIPAVGTITDMGTTYMPCTLTYACSFYVTESSPSTGNESALSGATIDVKCGSNDYTTTTGSDGRASTGSEITGTTCDYTVYKSEHRPETGTCTTGQTTKISLAPMFSNYEVTAQIDGKDYLATYGKPTISIPSGRPITSLMVVARSYLGAIMQTSDWLDAKTPVITTTCSWVGTAPATFQYLDNGDHAHITADGSTEMALICDSGETLGVQTYGTDPVTFHFTAADQSMRAYDARAWINGTDSVAYFDLWDPTVPEYIDDATCTVNGTAAAFDGQAYTFTITGSTSPQSLLINCTKTGYSTALSQALFYPALATLHRAYCEVPKHAPGTITTIQCEANVKSANATYDAYDLSTRGLEITTDSSLKYKTIRYASLDGDKYVFLGTLDSSRGAGQYSDVARITPSYSWLDAPDDSIAFPHVIGFDQISLKALGTAAPASVTTGGDYYCSANAEWPQTLQAASFEFTADNDTYSVFASLDGTDPISGDATSGIYNQATVVQTQDTTLPDVTKYSSGDTIVYGQSNGLHRITFIRRGFETTKKFGLSNNTNLACRVRITYKTDAGSTVDYTPYANTAYNPGNDLLGAIAQFFKDITSDPAKAVLLITLLAIPLVIVVVFMQSRPHNQARRM